MTKDRWTWLAAVLIALFWLLTLPWAAGAQVCDYDITATGGDRWQVYHADTLVSEHTTYYSASEVGVRLETESPAAETELRHAAVHRVECPVPSAPSVPSVVSVRELGGTDSTATYRATWEASTGAERYGWATENDSATWRREGATPDTTATWTSPRPDTTAGAWFCVRALNAAGQSESACRPYDVPNLWASIQEPVRIRVDRTAVVAFDGFGPEADVASVDPDTAIAVGDSAKFGLVVLKGGGIVGCLAGPCADEVEAVTVLAGHYFYLSPDSTSTTGFYITTVLPGESADLEPPAPLLALADAVDRCEALAGCRYRP